MDPFILRSFERIIAVIIGGISIYLGYRLFFHVPWSKDAEGKFSLPGGFSIYLNRVGPGVFFALFGTVVVALSLYMAVTFKESERIEVIPGTRVREIIRYGFGGIGSGFGGTDIIILRNTLRPDMVTLNSLPSYLQGDLDDRQKGDIQSATHKFKLALISTVWGTDWGEYAKFEDWVFEKDARGSPPPGLEEAAKYYNAGKGREAP